MLFKKLKSILQSNIFIILLIIITIIYSYNTISNNKIKSNYSIKSTEVNGYIKKIKIDGNKMTFYIDDIIANYYAEEEVEFKKYNIGDYVKIKGIFSIPSESTTPNLFNYRKYLYSNNIHYIVSDVTITKIDKKIPINYLIKRYILNYINNLDNSDYFLTFILGDNSKIDDLVLKSYSQNGVSHLFALSGMHVTLLSSILLCLLNKVFKKNISYIIVIIFLIMYVCLTNYSKSIIRACILFIIVTINKMFDLKLDIKKCYIIFTMIIILINPYNIFNNAFLFSYTISFYLICFGSIINKFKSYFIKVLVTSIISFLASLPIMINSYFEVNLISFIINIVFVPLISIVIFPLTLLAFVIPIVNPILSIVISINEYLSLSISNIKCFNIILCHIDFKIFLLYYFIITFVLHKIKNNSYKYIVIIIISLIIHTNVSIFKNYTLLSFIDVGQGDSILISLPHNKGNILIDTGGIINYEMDKWKQKKHEYSIVNSITIPYLKSIGIKSVDYLILTHGDYDHLGEAINLLENYKVKNVILNSGYDNYYEKKLIDYLNNKKIKYIKISNYSLNINNYQFDFINDQDIKNENEDSLVIKTIINDTSILLMGDAGENTEKYLINEYNLDKVDILKIGHHGSRNSTSDEFLKIVNPKYAIISVGLNNKFNHPHQETLDKLKNICTYQTSIMGTITFKID